MVPWHLNVRQDTRKERRKKRCWAGSSRSRREWGGSDAAQFHPRELPWKAAVLTALSSADSPQGLYLLRAFIN